MQKVDGTGLGGKEGERPEKENQQGGDVGGER